MTRKPRCPACGRPAGAGKDNPWRPFCCERCRLIDLGDWMEGRHRIPSDEPAPESGTEPPVTKH